MTDHPLTRVQQPTGMFAPLVRSLQRRDELNEEEQSLILALPSRIRRFAAGEELVPEGSRPKESCLIVGGFAGRAKFVAGGKRQLTAMHVPGDFVDLHAFLLKVMDHSVVALGPCLAAFVPHTELHAITKSAPHLTRMLWLSTVVDGAIEREWVTSLGRRPASAHLAHLICELAVRLDLVGLLESGSRFDLPLTQADIADVVGLSLVHVNRTIQDLRASGFLRWDRKKVTILDLARLRSFADFDPTYLNLMKEPR